MGMMINIGAPQGWQCPICKRVYSPTTMMCMYCGGEQKTTITTSAALSEPYKIINTRKDVGDVLDGNDD